MNAFVRYVDLAMHVPPTQGVVVVSSALRLRHSSATRSSPERRIPPLEHCCRVLVRAADVFVVR